MLTERAQHGQQLSARQASRLRRAGAGRVRGVEHVNIDRNVHGAIAKASMHALDSTREAFGLQLDRADDCEAEAFVVAQVLLAVQRPANADVQAGLLIDEPLLARTTEGGAVRDGCPEVGVPGVEVCVEVHDRHGATLALGGDAKKWQGDGVVAADRDEARATLGQIARGGLDGGNSFGDVEGVRGNVAGVDDLDVYKRQPQ